MTDQKYQDYFNMLSESAGCSTASSQIDCLQQAPEQAIIDFVNTTPAQFSPLGVNLSWGPLIDGTLFKQTLKQSFRAGQFAEVPILAGQNDDE